MKSPWWIRAFSLLCSPLAASWSHVSRGALQEAIDSNGYTLVAFVNPSQEASKTLESEWETVAKNLDDASLSFDCSGDLKTCLDHDVVSYPTIRLYHRDGRMDRYKGPRKATPMIQFVQRVLRPALMDVNDQSSPSFLTWDNIVFIGRFLANDQSGYDNYKAQANRYRDRYSFGIHSKAAKDKSTIRCRNNLDEEDHTLDELWRVEAFENFVRLCTEPLIPEITRKNEERYSTTDKSYVHFFATADKEKEDYQTDVRALAKKYSYMLQFTITDAAEYPDKLTAFGLEEGSKSGLVVQNPESGDFFPYSGKEKITAAVVERFLDDILEGRVQPSRPGGVGGFEQQIKHEEL